MYTFIVYYTGKVSKIIVGSEIILAVMCHDHKKVYLIKISLSSLEIIQICCVGTLRYQQNYYIDVAPFFLLPRNMIQLV